MKEILVLCTGNSCRSIIAEALINNICSGRYNAVSAGSFPTGNVHSKSLETLALHNINIKNPRSKSWDEFIDTHFDLIITVCDEAAGEVCPIFPSNPKKLHWSISDPAKAEGSDNQVNTAFDEAYEMLKKRIENELL